jgi:Tfp pilus assembly protein PilV
MPTINNQDGTSLVEVLIAVSLFTVVVVTLSLAFPIASKNTVQNRQSWVATNLASSQIANLKSQPYAYLDATAASFFGAGSSCDCTALDFSALPSASSQNAGTTFQVKSCVNFVSPVAGFPAQCPAAGDTGYKNILVRVFWTTGAFTHSVTQESSMTRS